MEAMGVIDLGLTVAEFWAMTPRHVLSLSKRWREAEARKDRRTGLIGFYLYNAMGAKKESGASFTPADFGLEQNGGVSHTGKWPTVEELLEAERRGEEMLKAKAEGRPNPFPPDPNAEGDIANIEAYVRASQ
jgi:hypothetical protein